MLSPLMLAIFYVVCAILIAVLLVRYFARLRAEREVQPRSAAAPVKAMASDTARSSDKVSWEKDALFKGSGITSGFGEDVNPLPHVEPAEVPQYNDDYALGPVTPVLASLLPETETRKAEIKQELNAAGYYQPHAYQNLSAFRYLGVMVPLVLIGLLVVLAPRALEVPLLLLLLVVPVLGWVLPRLVLKSQAKERIAEIERGMPDMLDMLNMCVAQGMTVQQSLSRISGELKPVYPALSKELSIIVQQSQVGTMQDALGNFSRRIDHPDVHSFVTLLTQTERMGTSVSAALNDYSDNMRESLRQRADEKANKASFKLLFPTVLCLMPAVFLFLLGPAIIELNDFFSGRSAETLNQNIQELGNLPIPIEQ